MAELGPVVVAEGLVVAHRSGGPSGPLRGVDLEVESGKITALVGPNGAGKSTLILALLGLSRSRAGQVRVAGVSARTYRLRHGVGYLPEDPFPSPGWTVAEWVGMSARIRGYGRRRAREEAATLLAALRLCDVSRERVDRLSKGTTRRVALAFALAGQPPLVMLDEPLSGLDPPSATRVREVLMGVRARGATVVVTAHDPRSAPGPPDRTIVLEHGCVAARLAAAGRRVGAERPPPHPRDER